jgi:hypothetical protein
MIPPLSLIEPPQPLLHQFERLVVCPVMADAPALRSGDESGLFEHAQVPGRGRPGMAKAGGDFARRHFAAAKMDGHENLTPGWMGQGSNDCIELRQMLLCFTSGH